MSEFAAQSRSRTSRAGRVARASQRGRGRAHGRGGRSNALCDGGLVPGFDATPPAHVRSPVPVGHRIGFDDSHGAEHGGTYRFVEVVDLHTNSSARAHRHELPVDIAALVFTRQQHGVVVDHLVEVDDERRKQFARHHSIVTEALASCIDALLPATSPSVATRFHAHCTVGSRAREPAHATMQPPSSGSVNP